MKKTAFVLIATLIVASPLMACECNKGDKARTAKSKAARPATGKVEKRVITGSYIPQQVRQSGQITDSASPVAVIDQDAIRKSGAADVRELLVRRGTTP